MSDKKMTKTEARAFVKRAREALRELDYMLDHGATEGEWSVECFEASGSVAALLAPVEDGFGRGPGINGITREDEAVRA